MSYTSFSRTTAAVRNGLTQQHRQQDKAVAVALRWCATTRESAQVGVRQWWPATANGPMPNGQVEPVDIQYGASLATIIKEDLKSMDLTGESSGTVATASL